MAERNETQISDTDSTAEVSMDENFAGGGKRHTDRASLDRSGGVRSGQRGRALPDPQGLISRSL